MSITADRGWRTLSDLIAWLEEAPPWLTVPATEIAAHIRGLHDSLGEPPTEPQRDSTPEFVQSWRERIWLVHPETRLGRDEVCEALGKSLSWLYKKTSAREIPCRLDGPDGELVFIAGEIRAWIQAREVTVSEAVPHLEVA